MTDTQDLNPSQTELEHYEAQLDLVTAKLIDLKEQQESLRDRKTFFEAQIARLKDGYDRANPSP